MISAAPLIARQETDAIKPTARARSCSNGRSVTTTVLVATRLCRFWSRHDCVGFGRNATVSVLVATRLCPRIRVATQPPRGFYAFKVSVGKAAQSGLATSLLLFFASKRFFPSTPRPTRRWHSPQPTLRPLLSSPFASVDSDAFKFFLALLLPRELSW